MAESKDKNKTKANANPDSTSQKSSKQKPNTQKPATPKAQTLQTPAKIHASTASAVTATTRSAKPKKRRINQIHFFKVFILVFMVGSLLGLIGLAKYLAQKSVYYKTFNYSPKGETPLKVKVPKVTVLPESQQLNKKAVAIPVIFYHGVVEDSADDGVNVTRSNFLDQMVTLKREGYYTVDTNDLNDFYSGKRAFYGKPMIIAFDDGRVDSYRPTDDIFRQLGFKAVFYIVSGKQDSHTDPFFLSWKQIVVAHKSGRWDMQAHGWYSHVKIPIDEAGNESNPLTNRKWLSGPKRLETVEEASRRIENDYLQNVSALKRYLPDHQITSFALPFGDNGQKINNFANFPEARALNYSICQRYFKTCMLIDSQGYNFQEHDPLQTYRLEVRNDWTGASLLERLQLNLPVTPTQTIDYTKVQSAPVATRVIGAKAEPTPDGLLLESSDNKQGYINYILGNQNYYNYTFETVLQLKKGTSIYLNAYKFTNTSHSQIMSFGITGDILSTRFKRDGVETTLNEVVLAEDFDIHAQHTLKIALKGKHLIGYIDGVQLVELDLPTVETRGQIGYDAYGPDGSQLLIKSLSVAPTK